MSIIEKTRVKIVRFDNVPWNGEFNNQAEWGFAQFADVCELRWEYEPHVFCEEGHEAQGGYAPDFLVFIPGRTIYVEIHGSEKADKSHRQLVPKRQRIRWLGRHTGIPVLLLHYNNWPEDLEDFMRLVRRAEIAATFEHADPTPLRARP